MIFILKRFLINFINTTMKRLSFRDKLKLFEKKIEPNTGENIPPKKNESLPKMSLHKEKKENPSRKKNYTNFEEMLSKYKECKFNKSNEEDLINEFKIVFDFYQEKKSKIDKEIEGKKLFLFRFKKAKELIQIYKIFELLTDAISKIIEYKKISYPSDKELQEYNKIKVRGKKIINFKNKEENSIIKKDPELDEIIFFSEEESNKQGSNNSIKNTNLNTLNDDFETRKDCHLIKNNMINFIPQIEINFSDDMEITKEMILDLKTELKDIFEEENFSIIEINKGSTHFLLSLQFIFKKLLNKSDKINELSKKIKNKVSQYIEKIKNYEFGFFGKKGKKIKANSVNRFVKDIDESEKEIIQIFQEKVKGEEINEKTNFYEASKSFSINDFNEVIDYLSTEDLAKQEYEQLLKNYGEYYNIFERDFEKALAFSIFEYQLVRIYTIDRDDYDIFKENKNNCPNAEEKLLFHGTKVDYIVSILKTFIDINRNTCTKLGKGFYLSDLFEVSWRYRSSTSIDYSIPKIGDSFSILVCNTYFSKNNVELCYKPLNDTNLIPINHLRLAKVKSDTSEVITEEELKDYKYYIQNEYLISHQEQILPIYAICIRRVEYLIIWRDNNFDKNNPNNYDDFDKMFEFNVEMQNYAYRELNTKIYYVKTTEEGLKLIDRKKYNKIIIITNGGNNGEEFIKESRKIMGGNPIAYVSCYIPNNHIDWVSKLPNTILSDDKEIFQDFLKYAVTENKKEMKNLKIKIEEKYGKEFNEFNEDTAFDFPKFLKEGEFSQLEFDPKNIK